MKIDDKQLDQALRLLAQPELPPELAERVRRIALAEVEPHSADAVNPIASAIGGLLIPAMISSAAVVCTVDTVQVARAAFADGAAND